LKIRVDAYCGAGGGGDVTMLVNIVIMVVMMMNLIRTEYKARSRYTAQWRTLVNSVIDMTQH
jgi:hypothetical protein